MHKKILFINCSYNENSITDKIMREISTHFEKENISYEMLYIREYEFSSCINCRVCTQNCGEIPGECVNRDKMNEIVQKIEQSDAYVIASPAKFQSTAKFFKCFMGRLRVYSYWPFGAKEPKLKKEKITKKAIVIGAFPIPNYLAKIYSKTINQLKKCTRLIGAQIVDTIYIGMAPIGTKRSLTEDEISRAKEASIKLIKSLQI